MHLSCLSCFTSGLGITSPGFPGNYSVDTYCAIAVNTSKASPLLVEAFSTEPGFVPGPVLLTLPWHGLPRDPRVLAGFWRIWTGLGRFA